MKEYKFHLSKNVYFSVKINEKLNLNKKNHLGYARQLILLEARHLILNKNSFLEDTYPIVVEEIMEEKDEKRTATEGPDKC